MTRDEARKLWQDSGLTYAVLSWPNIERLEEILDFELTPSGLMRGTYRLDKRRTKMYKPPNFAVEIRCKAHYFENREAVTFNINGFVGFAGWADDINIQPILSGFSRWVNEMVAGSRHRAQQEA